MLFYFTFYVLNVFRALIYPSSGACDYSVELPHWSYCSWFDVCWSFGVVGLEWYPCCRLKPATRIPHCISKFTVFWKVNLCELVDLPQVSFSYIFVAVYQTIRRHLPRNNSLYIYHCENLRVRFENMLKLLTERVAALLLKSRCEDKRL